MILMFLGMIGMLAVIGIIEGVANDSRQETIDKYYKEKE